MLPVEAPLHGLLGFHVPHLYFITAEEGGSE
jgi:hypothetical protein